MQTKIAALLAMLLILGSNGCDGSNRVSGQVTYEGKAVEKGQITFLPADGQGPIVGAAIVNGKYSVTNVPFGKKIVQISSNLSIGSPIRSLEEIAKKGDQGGEAPGIGPHPDAIPTDAIGNNVSIEVRGGQSDLNFDLKKPGN